MKTILFAAGNEAFENAVMNQLKNISSEEYKNIGYVLHKETIIPKCNELKPDILILNDDLDGGTPTLEVVREFKENLSDARLIFITKPRQVGDPTMASVVAYGYYDIAMENPVSVRKIAELIVNPNNYQAVSRFMPNMMTSKDGTELLFDTKIIEGAATGGADLNDIDDSTPDLSQSITPLERLDVAKEIDDGDIGDISFDDEHSQVQVSDDLEDIDAIKEGTIKFKQGQSLDKLTVLSPVGLSFGTTKPMTEVPTKNVNPPVMEETKAKTGSLPKLNILGGAPIGTQPLHKDVTNPFPEVEIKKEDTSNPYIDNLLEEDGLLDGDDSINDAIEEYEDDLKDFNPDELLTKIEKDGKEDDKKIETVDNKPNDERTRRTGENRFPDWFVQPKKEAKPEVENIPFPEVEEDNNASVLEDYTEPNIDETDTIEDVLGDFDVNKILSDAPTIVKMEDAVEEEVEIPEEEPEFSDHKVEDTPQEETVVEEVVKEVEKEKVFDKKDFQWNIPGKTFGFIRTNLSSSVTSLNLAYLLAEKGKKVAIVDTSKESPLENFFEGGKMDKKVNKGIAKKVSYYKTTCMDAESFIKDKKVNERFDYVFIDGIVGHAIDRILPLLDYRFIQGSDDKFVINLIKERYSEVFDDYMLLLDPFNEEKGSFRSISKVYPGKHLTSAVGGIQNLSVAAYSNKVPVFVEDEALAEEGYAHLMKAITGFGEKGGK